MKQHLSI